MKNQELQTPDFLLEHDEFGFVAVFVAVEAPFLGSALVSMAVTDSSDV